MYILNSFLDKQKLFIFIKNEMDNITILPTLNYSHLPLLYTIDSLVLDEIYGRYCQNYIFKSKDKLLTHINIDNNINNNRIGYITSDLDNSFIYYLLYYIILYHDKSKNEIYIFTTNKIDENDNNYDILKECSEYITLYSNDPLQNANIIKKYSIYYL